MKPVLNDVLQDLCTTPGPSGFERDIAQKAKAYLSPVSDSLTVDNVGNVIARIDGTDPVSYTHLDVYKRQERTIGYDVAGLRKTKKKSGFHTKKEALAFLQSEKFAKSLA